MEPIFTQKETAAPPYLAPDGLVSPWGLLRFAMNAAGAHSKYISADWETLAEKGVFWAVIRHRMVISRYPKTGEVVTVETWPMPTTRSAYPRAIIAHDEQGNEVFRLVSLWVLVDIHKRKMVLPDKSGIEVKGILRGNELAEPAKILPQELKNSTRRQVTEAEIDRNGHMNNAKYLSWSLDLIPPEAGIDKHPKEVEICYLSESRLGQELILSRELSDDGILRVEGCREETDTPGKTSRVFAAKLHF